MTDETFISEKTGKKYRILNWKEIPADQNYRSLYAIEEIIEPKLEENDWIQLILKENGVERLDLRLITNNFVDLKDSFRIIEIRKSNGEVWKKINGEWVKC